MNIITFLCALLFALVLIATCILAIGAVIVLVYDVADAIRNRRQRKAETQVFNRQNPMPVKNIIPYGPGFIADCPVCDRTTVDESKYCADCGQKLDWKEAWKEAKGE